WPDDRLSRDRACSEANTRWPPGLGPPRVSVLPEIEIRGSCALGPPVLRRPGRQHEDVPESYARRLLTYEKFQGAGAVAKFDQFAVAPGVLIGAAATDDREQLFRRRRVEELGRDRSLGQGEGDQAEHLSLEIGHRADAAVVADDLTVDKEIVVQNDPIPEQEPTGRLILKHERVIEHDIETQSGLIQADRSRFLGGGERDGTGHDAGHECGCDQPGTHREFSLLTCSPLLANLDADL